MKWTNSHVQRQLVENSIDSDNECVMRSRLNDTNISEACIRVSEITRISGTFGRTLRRTARDSICNRRISVNEIPRTDARSSSCQYGHE